VSNQDSSRGHETFLRARVRVFAIPPIHDALVIGRRAPIGCEAFKRALNLLVPDHFEDLHPDDAVVSDILIRSTFLHRVPPEKLVQFVLRHIKPLMSDEEVLHLDLECELTLEGQV
jgi:hypothetical protein